MTPEQLKLLFDGNAIFVIFVWGLVCKYVPALKWLPNVLIPWIGAAGYIFARLMVPDAQAQIVQFPPDSNMVTTGLNEPISTFAGLTIGGFANAIWARQLWEGFARFAIEWVSLRFTKKRFPGEDITRREMNARAAE